MTTKKCDLGAYELTVSYARIQADSYWAEFQHSANDLWTG